jgi:TPR repeat protein
LTKAREWWYTKAATQNDLNAYNNLGNIYYYGDSVEVDSQLALQYYQTAAYQGDSFAQTQLADMYHRGIGIKKKILERQYRFAQVYRIKTIIHGSPLAKYAIPQIRNFKIFQKHLNATNRLMDKISVTLSEDLGYFMGMAMA